MKLNSDFSTLDVGEKPKTKWRESIFLVTINTNKSYNSNNLETLNRMPEIDKEFDDLLHNLFAKHNLIKLFVNIGKPGSKQRTKLTDEHVQSIDAHTQKEINHDIRGFLHAHTTIKIVHDTRVLINLPLIRTVVKKKMEKVLTINGKFTSPYVGVKSRGTAYNIENYVKKEN